MSRWDANSDLDYTDMGGRFTRPCERPGCPNAVDLSAPSVFCADCLADAEARVMTQRTRELHERRRAS
jgi:hypothetical protein